MEQCLDVEDRCISKHHLAIHCVQYADDDDHNVDPMVWARVLSNNAIIFHRKGIDNDKDAGILVNKFHGDFLLSPGDSMQLTSKIQILFTVPERGKPKSSALDASQRSECKIFAPRYRLSQRVLGFGGYAKVYVANDEKTGKQLACKVVKQARPRHDDDNQMRPSKKRSTEIVAREFNVLKKLSHPNIIQLEAVISTPYNVYIFQDLISGGDLMSHVEKTGCLQEPQAAVIIRQLLEAVKYLHAHQIAHRDIKPENILMTSWKEGGRIVLTDFGQSRTIEDLEVVAAKAGAFRMQTMVGTCGYVAPYVRGCQMLAIDTDAEQGNIAKVHHVRPRLFTSSGHLVGRVCDMRHIGRRFLVSGRARPQQRVVYGDVQPMHEEDPFRQRMGEHPSPSQGLHQRLFGARRARQAHSHGSSCKRVVHTSTLSRRNGRCIRASHCRLETKGIRRGQVQRAH